MLKLGKKMSSPTKQVSVRRLPPLPNQVTLRNLKENGTANEDNRIGSIRGKPSGGRELMFIFPVNLLMFK